MDTPDQTRRQLVLAGATLAVLAGAALMVRQAACVGPVMGERFVVPYAAGLDLTGADQTVELDGMKLRVTAGPRPLAPLNQLDFHLRVDGPDGALSGLAPELAFNMDMDMGRFVSDAVPEGDGYSARIVLPVCIYGGHRWYLRIRFEYAGRRHESVLLFDL